MWYRCGIAVGVWMVVLGAGISAARGADDDTRHFPSFANLADSMLSVDQPPVRTATVADDDQPAREQQALVPLPPGAWTGMTGLAALTLMASRKAIARFVR